MFTTTRTLLVCLILALATVATGCYSTKQIAPRAQPSNARIALEVISGEWHIGSLDTDLNAKLKVMVLEKRLGQLVVDGAKPDLKLKVTITDTNFTAALAFDWQLIDVESGTVVLAGSETSMLGMEAEEMAYKIVERLVQVDTNVYAGDGPVPPPAVVTPTPINLDQAPDSETDGSNAWAVIIGVERYRNGLSPATGAETDASAFAAFAQKTLGVPEANIKVLLGERASRSDMMGALTEWLPRNAVEPGGTVYVFFSGHGAPDVQTGDAYLVPYDADPAYLKSGGVPLTQVQDTLRGLKNQQVYVFLDACFSGQGDRSVLAEGTRPLVPVKPIESSGAVITFSASQAAQTTGAHASSGHGLFTHHLLDGIGGGADANEDGDVTMGELIEHVSSRVEVEARRQNRDQQPSAAIPSGVDPAKLVLVKGIDR